MKLQQMKQGQFFLSLPSAIVRAKGWKKGDNVSVNISGEGDIVLRKVMFK